nr:MAG: hypothetical protein [Microviridae sp.]
MESTKNTDFGKQRKSHTNVEKAFTNRENYSSKTNEKQTGNLTEHDITNNEELIKKYPVGTMVEIVNYDKHWFLTMGINRISPIFNDVEELHQFIDGDKIELICSIALTIATVLIKEQLKKN